MDTRQYIRSLIRQRRRNLSSIQQQQAERSITYQALQLVQEYQAQHIALFLSFDGEVSTRMLIKQLWQKGKSVYLPVLHPFSNGNLLFLSYCSDTVMSRNKLGIAEPKLDVRNVFPVERLDVIFTPLVAFDKQGNRLGMGGGFYDRTLQNWQQKNFIPIGIAHSCQEVEQLPTEHWDIPLTKILVG